MTSRTFALMFLVEDGGVSSPVEWSKGNLKSENIVMVLDEENMAVWLWFGAKRGLVSKRTALRQAQSLKGHGYTIGKSIVGRGLDTIYEIDERKIGRDSETDELNNKFMELLSRSVTDAGGFVITFGGPSEPLPIEEHFEQAQPIEVPIVEPKSTATQISASSQGASAHEVTSEPESFPEPPVSVPFIDPTPIPKTDPLETKEEQELTVEEPPIIASEYADDDAVPEPAPLFIIKDPMESVQKGCVVMAILSHFKDIWVSRLDEKTVSIEYMDGPIAKFHIEEGKVKFHEGSFNDIDPTIKSNIQTTFYTLIDALKK
ncbi:MAG: hypothetical protein JW776_13055 [Candidatus Lokiarchaeota archaeon]|nr:hypothetical protein [Candidatus Lokiarchaeota archaeon]